AMVEVRQCLGMVSDQPRPPDHVSQQRSSVDTLHEEIWARGVEHLGHGITRAAGQTHSVRLTCRVPGGVSVPPKNTRAVDGEDIGMSTTSNELGNRPRLRTGDGFG